VEVCDFLPWRGIRDGRPGDGGGDGASKYSDGDKSPFLGLRPGESDEVDEVEDVEVVDDTERLFRLYFFSMLANWCVSL
jgi:hypothetical protein